MPGSCIIAVAHSQHSPGTGLPELGITEHDVSMEQTAVTAERIRERGCRVEAFDCAAMTQAEYLREIPRRICDGGPWGLALTMHHNAAGYQTHQHGLVIHWAGSRQGRRAAMAIARTLHIVVPWPVKISTHLSYPRAAWFLRVPGSPAVLVEAGFFAIDGHSDPRALKYYGAPSNRDTEARAVGNGIADYLEDIT